MTDNDPPPPYTAEDETKFNPALQPTAPAVFKPPTLPSAPTGYETVAYYPAASTSGNASILLQPQQQQQQQQQQPQQQPQHQVIVVQTPQVVVVPQVQQSFTTHICLSCLSCLCCFSALCCIVAFILAGKCSIPSSRFKHARITTGL